MPKALEAQRDFSAGEIDVSAKRSDQSAEIAPLLKAGLRRALNVRIRNSKALRNRPGRRVLFLESGRVEKVLMSPGNYFYLAFGAGTLRVYNSTGTQVFATAGFPWTLATANSVNFAVFRNSIYICYPGMRPQVLIWDGVATWSVAAFTEAVGGGGQKRTPFYRISPPNITLLPSATTGIVNITFSAGMNLVAGHVGTRMRFCNRQIQILTVTSPTTGTAVVIEPLPPGQRLTTTANVGFFNIGDVVQGSTSGAKGLVTGSGNQQGISFSQTPGSLVPAGYFQVGDAVSGGTSGATGTVISVAFGPGPSIASIAVALSTGTAFVAVETITGPHGSAPDVSVGGANLVIQLLQSASGIATPFVAETVVGPSGSATVSTVTTVVPQAVTVWDDEVMNDLRGYPASCFVDQNRLGFCNFSAVPSAIAWSAIGGPTDLLVGAQPSDAMFELAPDKVQIYYVLAGPESSEFVFCDRKVFYIPISVTNPLAPGRVAFNILSSSGSLPVQPRVIEEDIVYLDGQNTINSITAPGMYYRPYGTRNLTELATHLLNKPVAIAIPTQQGTFAEQYIYVLNGDGTVAVGKYETENGQIKGVVGWVPWSGNGTVSWISAADEAVIFTSVYPGAKVVEALDDTLYLDAAMLVNAAPAALAPPGGGLTGPLWWMAGRTVDLMDQATRMMGTYQIDASGNIVPQNNGGEDLTAASLVAGQFFQLTVEPFLPAAPPGPDAHQRMTKRRISRLGAHVSRSSGFCFIKIASRIGPQLPPVGTVTIIRRVPTWNQDDDPTLPPPLRETTHNTRPSGRDFDPRAGLMKDTPGPWEILEIDMEAST